MEKYPLELVTHEAPLLIVSGLGSPPKYSQLPPYPLLDTGPVITSELPPITGHVADHLLDFFLQHDSTGVWVGRPERGLKGTPPVYRIRAVGREYRLPPRKANAPSPGASGVVSDSPPARNLHSPISPLSPDSPLYPDGVMSHIWLRKHHSVLPAIFISFFELYTETNDVRLQNIKDNEVIAAINSSKKQFAATSSNPLSATIGSDESKGSGHRTRFVVVILSEGSILSSPQIDERLGLIKRSTNLTTNTTFFFLPVNASTVELQHFVSSLLLTLHPVALDYYRELSKHARRKRNRGSIPPPTIPTSRALSSQAWTLRYELKLGIFAEFRQEMDIAGRNYETAYEKLLAEVFETTSSWNERWKEARLLADILSLRIIRCQLWIDGCVAAKRRWSYHITRMRELLDRRGRGTETYGFAAWMSRWNKCLAEIVQLASPYVFSIPPSLAQASTLSPDSVEQNPLALYARPGKVNSIVEPWTSQDCLHHAGFYLLNAAEWVNQRKSRAERVSAEDADIHDTYLCLEPQEETVFDHAGLRVELLVYARKEFDLRQQKRMSDYIACELAALRMPKAPKNVDLWGEALRDLRIAASTYRREGWWHLLEDVLWRTVECGRNNGDGGSAIVAELELMSKVFRQRKGWDYRLGRCLEGIDTLKVKPTMVVRSADVVSMLSVSYAFESRKIHVGEHVLSQLTVTSHAQMSSRPLVFAELKVAYEGLKTVLLRHDPSITATSTDGARFIDLKRKVCEQNQAVDEPPSSPTSANSYLVGSADLTLGPGETRIYEMSTILREAGDTKAMCATFNIVGDRFELDLLCMLDDDDFKPASLVHPLPFKKQFSCNGGKGVWWYTDGNSLKKRPVWAAQPTTLHVHPRPPKMEVIARGLENGTYVDEVMTIGIEVTNGEDEEANVNVSVRILGWPEDSLPDITWISADSSVEPETPSLHPLGNLKPLDKTTHHFKFLSPSIPADCALEIKLKYSLVPDPDTPIEKMVVAEMPIITPFHPTFNFSPRVHPHRWPNYFSLGQSMFDVDKRRKPQGITQRWCLTANILGVAEQSLLMEAWELCILRTDGDAECMVQDSNDSTLIELSPTKSHRLAFLLDIQKYTLEDRSPSEIDTSLRIKWRRSVGSPLVCTTLLVPHLFVPLREPRLLAVASPSERQPIVELSYTIENPTTYFLTFNILHDPNEQFAFSGPKQTSLQLLPMSRVALNYRLYPYVRGAYVRPKLRVVDRYFNKELRTAGGEGIEHDKEGLMVWVPADLC